MANAVNPRQQITPRTWLALGLAAVTLLALGLRLWDLTQLPPGYWYDEAHKSLVALQIARGERAPIYVTDNQGIEAGYFWLLAAWFRLAGPSFYGTRVLSALIGTATVPLTYWSLREVYRPLAHSRLIALLAAAWLSFLLWHVHWSRLGLETITVPLFAVGLLGMMAWAGRRASTGAYVAAGVVVGLSQYTNPGARLLVVQAAVTFLLFARGSWRARLKFGAALGLAALLVYLPLGLFFVRQPEWFFNRIAFTSTGARAGGLAVLFSNAVKTLGSINFRGDGMARHNLALRPALDPLSSLLMLAAATAMWASRAHWRRHVALLAALGLGLVPMVFSDGAPGFGRTLGATPLVAALPALGLVALTASLRRRTVAAALIAAAVAASAALSVYDYFVRYPRQPDLFDSFEMGQWALLDGAYTASRAGTGYVILNEAGLAHPAAQLAQRLSAGDLRAVNGQVCLAYPAVATRPTNIGVLAEWASRLQAQFPQVIPQVIMHEPEVYAYGYEFNLPAGTASLAAATPEVARLGDAVALLEASWTAAPVEPGATVPISLSWRVLEPLPQALNVFVHLGSPGQQPLAGADGPPCGEAYGTDRWHADEIIEHRVQLALPVDLPPGAYPLFVGLYDWVTGARLTVAQADGVEPDRAIIGTLTVAAP